MQQMNRRALIVATCLLGATGLYAQGLARDSAEIERDLPIEPPGTGTPRRLDLAAAIRALNIPSVSVALIDGGTLDWARVFGRGATADTLYQAASLSKLVTAVAALRLVEQARLALDRDVNEQLTGWRLPDSPLTRGHPVTLRGLLSMTAGIGVPGYVGYAPEQPLPDLVQILDGAPPANSPPVRVESVPGARYAYSGGGYEIVQALIETVTGRSFEGDAGTRPPTARHVPQVQPLPPALVGRAAEGHDASGAPLPGGWRVVPELAAGGLWSTPTDLAKLLIAIARAFRGERPAFLGQATARAMLTRQSVGPYGLGGAVATARVRTSSS
jgi:CubicO group peptidase (beta-lactamase class C family)